MVYLRATERMKSYKPAEHLGTSNVAPLVQFFELVHLGDTIQSMVQVYFDRALVSDLNSESQVRYLIEIVDALLFPGTLY